MEVLSVPEVTISTDYEFDGELEIELDSQDIDKLERGISIKVEEDGFDVVLKSTPRPRKSKLNNREYLDRTYQPATAWEAEVFGGVHKEPSHV